MSKQEFLDQLRARLSGLPRQDVIERLNFYSEMIDDRMEEGLSECEAVASIGSVDEIISQIVADMPLSKIVKEKIKPARQLKVWEILLLVLASPIWLSPAIAAVAVIVSLYASLWAVVISLWAVFASLAASFVGCLLAFFIFLAGGNATTGVAILAAGLVCAGLSIFAFYGCFGITRGIGICTKNIAIWVKKRFVK